MKLWRSAARAFALTIAGVLSLSLVTTAKANGGWQVAYVPVLGSAELGGMLVDWQSVTRVRVVNSLGARLGTVSPQGINLVIALDGPLSTPDFSGDLDSCGEFPDRRRDTAQFAIRDVPDDGNLATVRVVEMGTIITLTGCDAGLTVPFGALTDSGVAMSRVPMITRPSMHDLVPGTRIAGFSEQEWLAEPGAALAVDIVTLFSGGQALFASTGHVVPMALSADRWLVFNFGAFERAYTRLLVDDETGAETWLRAEWSGGSPQHLYADLVTKVSATAGFGSESQASRIWESGLFFRSQFPLLLKLYQGGTGERVDLDLTVGTEYHDPITWRFVGKNIAQRRLVAPGIQQGDRTWVPLRNRGDKIRFVMESEIRTNLADGSTEVFFPPRVNFYIDRGQAMPAPPN